MLVTEINYKTWDSESLLRAASYLGPREDKPVMTIHRQ